MFSLATHSGNFLRRRFKLVGLGVVFLAVLALLLSGLLSHKILILASNPDDKSNNADCDADVCKVIVSGSGMGQTQGKTLGPIPYSQTYVGGKGLGVVKQSAQGNQNYANRCTVGDAANGYDGNYFGIRGQTGTGADNPTWWYNPPTTQAVLGRTVAAACANAWNGGRSESYSVADSGYQSLNLDPANFIDPGADYGGFNGADFPAGLYAGWADNSTSAHINYIANHSGQTWRSPIVTGAASGGAGNFGAQFITCTGCTNKVGGGDTFIYRVPFSLDSSLLTDYTLTSAKVVAYGNNWASAWVDTMGDPATPGSAPSPCSNHGVCAKADTNSGEGLESGFGNGGDLTSYLNSNYSGTHILGIQTTVKSYIAGNNFQNQPQLAFQLVLKYTRKTVQASAGGIKTLHSYTAPYQQIGGLPPIEPGTPDTITYDVGMRYAPAAGDNVTHTITYIVSDPPPPCLTLSSFPTNTHTFHVTGTEVPDTIPITFGVVPICASSSQTNTATITYTVDGVAKPALTAQWGYVIVNASHPWIQTVKGDVHSNSSVTQGVSPGKGNSATYIVSAGGQCAFGSTCPGQFVSNFNSANCLVFNFTGTCDQGNAGSYGTIPWPWEENSNFFTTLTTLSNTGTVWGGAGCSLGATNGTGGNGLVGNANAPTFCYYGGNTTLTLPALTVSGAVTIYSPNANVFINGNISCSGGATCPFGSRQAIPSLGVIAGGVPTDKTNYTNSSLGKNVTINDAVTSIASTAIFSNGTIFTSDSDTFNQLKLSGLMVAMKIDLSNRDYFCGATGSPVGCSAAGTPSEIATYLPNIILNPPPGFLNLAARDNVVEYLNEKYPRLFSN